MYPTKTFWIRSCIQRIIKCDVILKPPHPLQNPGYASGDCTHCMPFFDKKCVKKSVFFMSKACKAQFSTDNFKILKKCRLDFDTKIQEALYIKKTHSKLNKQLYGHNASFLLSIF